MASIPRCNPCGFFLSAQPAGGVAEEQTSAASVVEGRLRPHMAIVDEHGPRQLGPGTTEVDPEGFHTPKKSSNCI